VIINTCITPSLRVSIVDGLCHNVTCNAILLGPYTVHTSASFTFLKTLYIKLLYKRTCTWMVSQHTYSNAVYNSRTKRGLVLFVVYIVYCIAARHKWLPPNGLVYLLSKWHVLHNCTVTRFRRVKHGRSKRCNKCLLQLANA
jgi:hypothetical protein